MIVIAACGLHKLEVNEKAYTTYVRPQLEYCSTLILESLAKISFTQKWEIAKVTSTIYM